MQYLLNSQCESKITNEFIGTIVTIFESFKDYSVILKIIQPEVLENVLESNRIRTTTRYQDAMLLLKFK